MYTIEINSQENIAIVGDAKGNITLYDTDTKIWIIQKEDFSIETNYSIISPPVQLLVPTLKPIIVLEI